MSLIPNSKEINIILNILKGAQFEFLPRAPFYIDTPVIEPPPPPYVTRRFISVFIRAATVPCPETDESSHPVF
jgi:hypothetical protein